jgi:hypothetical protein
MALPKQVEAQLKELEALEKQLSEGQQQQPVEPTEPAPAPTEPTEPATPEPAPTEPVESTPKPVEPQPQEEKWEQKYKTLKGMYDAEVPRLHAQLKELKAEMESFRKAAETKPVEQPKPAAKEKLVTDEDVQAFGADLIEVQRKVAREVAMEFRADLDAMKAENDELRKMLAQTGTQVSEATFEQRLHRLVPDFDEVNLDPKWVEWLNEVDPLLRAPRKSIAQQAFNNGDAEGVAHYVKLFKQSIEPAAEPSKAKAKTELERQIQPTRSAATAQSASPKGRIYTNADVQAMFNKAALLGAQGKLEEARKLEAEIDAAYMDGRVTA